MVRIPKLAEWDVIRIEWSDPSGLAGEWHKPSEKNMQIAGVVTVGQVYKLHADRVTVVCTWDPTNKHANGGMTIPYAIMDKIQVLLRAVAP